MYGNFLSQIIMSHLFADTIVQRMKENKSQRSKPKSNQQIKGRKTHEKKVNKSYVFNLQPDYLQALVHPLQWWFESSYKTRKHWKQSGKGTEPIPWSPIIRCARPWRETRAQSAINKGAWEGRVVTVTKMFGDRHRFPMRHVCITEANQKAFFQPLVECFGAKSSRTAI